MKEVEKKLVSSFFFIFLNIELIRWILIKIGKNLKIQFKNKI